MKTRIALGAGLLLTLGTAVAGTFIYGQGKAATPEMYFSGSGSAASEATPEMIAMWKATAASSDYVAPRVPI